MKIEILGSKIDNISFEEAIGLADNLINGGHPAQIVTANPEIVMTARRNEQYRQIINNSDLVFADGAGLLWAARRKKTPFVERITGVDFSWALFKLAEEKGYSVYLLGGKQGIAEMARDNILKVHPNLNIVGTSAGQPDEKSMNDVIAARPDILLVAFGAPKQEIFIFDLIHYFSNFGFRISDLPRLSLGVGGTLDYIAQKVPRAPMWLRRLGLEWLYRLILQPSRINRIITATIRFPLAVLREK